MLALLFLCQCTRTWEEGRMEVQLHAFLKLAASRIGRFTPGKQAEWVSHPVWTRWRRVASLPFWESETGRPARIIHFTDWTLPAHSEKVMSRKFIYSTAFEKNGLTASWHNSNTSNSCFVVKFHVYSWKICDRCQASLSWTASLCNLAANLPQLIAVKLC
jgi:hypothetical protein